MALLQIGEVFGNDTSVPISARLRNSRHCPFRDTPCTKDGKKDPLGICSYTDGTKATVVCPLRFLEGLRVFRDAAFLAFGGGKSFTAIPEVRVLEVKGAGRVRKIGKVDFLLAHIEGGSAVDFAALEMQSVYMSGTTIRPHFRRYIKSGELTRDSLRRSDFRSSGPKRLMPQLALKVPIFSRWGKKFFVVTDSVFFDSMPTMKPQSRSNAEVTWLTYDVKRQDGGGFKMGEPAVTHTLWVDVEYSLREGEAPEQSEMLDFLTTRSAKLEKFRT